VVFERLQINGEDEQPVFLNGRELLSSKLKKILGPCSEVVVFVSTIGDGIDDSIESIKEKHPGKAYVFDAIASLAAEKAADAFQESLDEVIPPESSMTLRYSPGYCDWNINDQKLIFDLVNPERIKVSLNGGCLMRPSKSISGLIGIGPKDQVKKNGNLCASCDRNDCEHRRLPKKTKRARTRADRGAVHDNHR